MTVRSSLRFRLAMGALLWSFGALALASGLFTAALKRHIARGARPVLEARLDELEGPEPPSGASDVLWQVEAVGHCQLRSEALGSDCLVVPANVPPGQTLAIEGPDHRSLLAMVRDRRPGAAPPARLVAALTLDPLDALVFDSHLLPATLLAGVALLLGGALTVHRALRPLGSLREALSAVRRGEDRTLAGNYPSEIQPLVDDLNGLLAHSDAVAARARAAAENLAHGLKTPLAILQNEAETLSRSSAAEAAGTLREQVRRMESQIESQLSRARAAVAGQPLGLRSAIGPSVDGLVRTMKRLHQARELQIETEAAPHLAFRGDGIDLEEMVGNLLDNACKWARRRVRLRCGEEGRELRLSVDDDGPGLSVEARALVFRRGLRLDERNPGSGLGLAIVRELAELYGGSVTICDSPLGGLRVELRLPSAGEALG